MIEPDQASRALPRYRSHKEVWALKIKAIEKKLPTIAELEMMLNSDPSAPNDAVGAIITPEEQGYAPFPVSQSYMRKHDPQVGGYWVIYKDGYTSWSPAEAFEEGYTLVK